MRRTPNNPPILVSLNLAFFCSVRDFNFYLMYYIIKNLRFHMIQRPRLDITWHLPTLEIYIYLFNLFNFNIYILI
jgi:hypothetical protein